MLIQKLVKQATIIGESEKIAKFMCYTYRFQIFRNILNLALSLIKVGRLSFKILLKRSSEKIEGLCETLQLGNSLKSKQYIITIKELNPYVIIHEIAHMIEKEMNLDLQIEFLPIVHQDVQQNLKNSNALVQKIINHIIFAEVKAYPNYELRASELFARYFELYAWTQEVYPKDREYLIRTFDLNRVFLNTNKWREKFLDPKLINATDKEVSTYSNAQLIVRPDQVQSKWSNKVASNNYKNIKSKFNDENI
ncbi:hypothetical protein [Candidatus Mesenet endosymbiont of Agriotes lineatus]|uniref:WD_0702 family putative metalloprotease n=1 Tax=Candidatus Mesenet endosymbiont of Agriotes lineatus TaxID=3077948 RepID=UPI0030CFF998